MNRKINDRSNKERIFRKLQSSQKTARDLSAELGITVRTVQRYVDELRSEKRVRTAGWHKNGDKLRQVYAAGNGLGIPKPVTEKKAPSLTKRPKRSYPLASMIIDPKAVNLHRMWDHIQRDFHQQIADQAREGRHPEVECT